MHSLYLLKCDEVGWQSVSEPTCHKTFCEHFNLRFGSPKSDTCKTCDSLKCQNSDATDNHTKQQLIKELGKHHIVAENGFKALKCDTELGQASAESMLVISFDLQHNFPTSYIHTGLVFYLRQLWVYNLV